MKNVTKVFILIFLYILFISVFLFKFYNINSNLYNNTNFIDFLVNFFILSEDILRYFLKIHFKLDYDSFILYIYELYIKIKK